MHSIQIRNIPNDLFEDVKKAAHESSRSITQEILHAIEAYLTERKNNQSRKQQKAETFKRIQALNKNEPLTDLALAMKWLNEDKK